MQSVIIISETSDLLYKINSIFGDGVRKNYKENQLNIELSKGRLYISFIEDGIEEEYDNKEIEIINKAFVGKRFFYLICFSGIEVINVFIDTISCIENLYIDDDMGNIIPINDYKMRFN